MLKPLAKLVVGQTSFHFGGRMMLIKTLTTLDELNCFPPPSTAVGGRSKVGKQ
ncbi:MAG: hypothetical protein ACTS6A_02470 [Candidatus Hodgkinia cicadicola]